MGELIQDRDFSEDEFKEFGTRLENQLGLLREQASLQSFNRESFSVGAELELYLLDDSYHPAPINEQLLKLADNPQLCPELNKYNLEYNAKPALLPGSPFKSLESEFKGILDVLQTHAESIDSNILPIGILPTLQESHFDDKYMTDRPRYHILRRALCGPYEKQSSININGKERLLLDGEGVTLEGANTSLQVHLRIPANKFNNYYNAAQLTAPMALALSANSPIMSGLRLWQESRIALFKQSVDFREYESLDWSLPSRVHFGYGWVSHGVWELFAHSVALFKPLIPLLYDEDDSPTPRLQELCLHHGTIWPWNRAVYSSDDGGHVRVEFRFLPAGPTVIDMVANAALVIGWAAALEEVVDQYTVRLPFRFAEYNFYRGAQHGLEAEVAWPRQDSGGMQSRSMVSLIEEFLPFAGKGLKKLGVDGEEADRLLRVIEERFETRKTGASWQLKRFEEYIESCSVEEACVRMLQDYKANMVEGNPVSQWD